MKYLHKYIHKGPDKAEIVLRLADGQDVDEIADYVEGRYISSSESIWRCLRFPLHDMSPAVKRLAVHLDGEQSVQFECTQSPAAVLSTQQPTTLLGWFEANERDASGRHLLYPDFAEEFRWDKGQWHRKF